VLLVAFCCPYLHHQFIFATVILIFIPLHILVSVNVCKALWIKQMWRCLKWNVIIMTLWSDGATGDIRTWNIARELTVGWQIQASESEADHWSTRGQEQCKKVTQLADELAPERRCRQEARM